MLLFSSFFNSSLVCICLILVSVMVELIPGTRGGKHLRIPRFVTNVEIIYKLFRIYPIQLLCIIQYSSAIYVFICVCVFRMCRAVNWEPSCTLNLSGTQRLFCPSATCGNNLSMSAATHYTLTHAYTHYSLKRWGFFFFFLVLFQRNATIRLDATAEAKGQKAQVIAMFCGLAY